MKIGRNTTIGAAVLACIAIAASAAPEGSPSVSIPVTQLKYGPTGVADGVHGEVLAAPAFGDSGHGAHGTFLRLPPGFVSPIHTHTEYEYVVVISGVGANTVPGGTDVPLPAGSYFFQKAGERHITKCISSNECVFFVSQPGKYDFLPNAAKQ